MQLLQIQKKNDHSKNSQKIREKIKERWNFFSSSGQFLGIKLRTNRRDKGEESEFYLRNFVTDERESRVEPSRERVVYSGGKVVSEPALVREFVGAHRGRLGKITVQCASWFGRNVAVVVASEVNVNCARIRAGVC